MNKPKVLELLLGSRSWVKIAKKLSYEVFSVDCKQFYKYGTSFFTKFFKPHLIWDWYDFGLMLKINKQNNIGSYHFAIDIQIGWLNLWLQCCSKH